MTNVWRTCLICGTARVGVGRGGMGGRRCGLVGDREAVMGLVEIEEAELERLRTLADDIAQWFKALHRIALWVEDEEFCRRRTRWQISDDVETVRPHYERITVMVDEHLAPLLTVASAWLQVLDAMPHGGRRGRGYEMARELVDHFRRFCEKERRP